MMTQRGKGSQRGAPPAPFEYHGGGVLSRMLKGRPRKHGGTKARRVYYIQYWWRGKRITEKVGLREDLARGKIAARLEARENPNWMPEKVKDRIEREAERKAKLEADEAKRAAEHAERNRLTFAQFSKLFLEQWASKRASKETWFDHMTRQLVREFGPMRLDEIDALRIEQWLTRRAQDVKATTANHGLRFLKNMLARAKKWGYLETNPAEGIRQLDEEPPGEHYLDQEQSDRLVAGAPPHLKPIIRLALLTGMRRGELLALRWDQVDLAGRQVTVISRKGRKVRTRFVALNDDAVRVLERVPKHTKHDRVFTYRGKPVASVKRSWEIARSRAGLPDARFHDLRHTWASRLVMKGVDLYTLMDLGGWSTVAMVQRYARFTPARRIEVAQLLNGTADAAAVPVAAPVDVPAAGQ